jgi:hypothetical protein
MKHLLATIIFVFFTTSATAADNSSKTHTKFVCKEVKDSKTGKFKKQCKQIKIHKKYEGTPVPNGKKK